MKSLTVQAHQLRVDDVIPGWGTIVEIKDSVEVIYIRTLDCAPNEWAMCCDRSEAVQLRPRSGHVVEIEAGRTCDFCGAPATWDIPTIYRGSWANACDSCEPQYHNQPGQTGVGIGQRLFPSI
jgi:hypothetical protein